MKLKLLYDSLRIEMFDTNELTEKKALGDRNLLTNYEPPRRSGPTTRAKRLRRPAERTAGGSCWPTRRT